MNFYWPIFLLLFLCRGRLYFSFFLKLSKAYLLFPVPICQKANNSYSVWVAFTRLKSIEINVPFFISWVQVPSICRVSKSTNSVPKPVPFCWRCRILHMPLSLILRHKLNSSIYSRLPLIVQFLPSGKAYFKALVNNSFTIKPTGTAVSMSKSISCISISTFILSVS